MLPSLTSGGFAVSYCLNLFQSFSLFTKRSFTPASHQKRTAPMEKHKKNTCQYLGMYYDALVLLIYLGICLLASVVAESNTYHTVILVLRPVTNTPTKSANNDYSIESFIYSHMVGNLS